MPEIQLTEKEAQELALKIEANDDKAQKGQEVPEED